MDLTRLVSRSIVPLGLACSAAACSASGDGSMASRRTGLAGAAEGDTLGENPGGLDLGGGAMPSEGAGLDLGNGVTTSTGGDGRACVTTSAEAVLMSEPVDIILVLDNSGSMEDELQAVEENININFANILQQSGIDYRVILISRHRQEARAASEEASTSICVSSPLSGLSVCPAEEPVLSERFFQYSIKIESTDSFDRILETYGPGGEEDKFDFAPNGWSQWLRPDARKVFLEMTDDNAAMPVDTFLILLTALAPDQFGPDPNNLNFVWHSIVGVGEKANPTDAYLPGEPINTALCTGNDNDVENAGESYQDLSIRTGGLRLPLCQFTAYDVVFQTIAQQVVVSSGIACEFDLPAAPEGSTLALDQIAVAYQPGDGSSSVQFGQAASVGACQANAFYLDNQRVVLCPETCSAINVDPFAQVDVLFTCESQIILR